MSLNHLCLSVSKKFLPNVISCLEMLNEIKTNQLKKNEGYMYPDPFNASLAYFLVV